MNIIFIQDISFQQLNTYLLEVSIITSVPELFAIIINFMLNLRLSLKFIKHKIKTRFIQIQLFLWLSMQIPSLIL